MLGRRNAPEQDFGELSRAVRDSGWLFSYMASVTSSPGACVGRPVYIRSWRASRSNRAVQKVALWSGAVAVR